MRPLFLITRLVCKHTHKSAGCLASVAASGRILMQIVTGLFALVLLSQTASAAIWNDVAQAAAKSSTTVTAGEPIFRQRRLSADPKLIAQQLQSASAALSKNVAGSTASIELPMPDGSMKPYRVVYSPIIANGQAANYPQFKTYKIYALDGSSMTGRVSITPLGFGAFIDTPQGTALIDPIPGSQAKQYRSYYKLDYAIAYKDKMPPFHCGVQNRPMTNGLFHTATGTTSTTLARTAAKTEGALRDYRIAIATTGEYSQAVTNYYGVALTKANVQSEIVKAVNRINQVYERDLGIHLNYVANQDIIYLDPASDQYTNDNPTSLLTENQSHLDSIIGSGNYDVGHVFSTGGGGLAAINAACQDSLDNNIKAQGETGLPQPVGDPFYIDFVAHELGHQFGADHTFNGTSGNCAPPNRNSATAYEPGSGSTIMGYAGTCSAEDIASNSDAVFHAGSVEEITNYTATNPVGTCPTLDTTLGVGNNAPVVSAGPDYTIPADTDFELNGSAMDTNVGDSLLYRWDEMDTGLATDSTTIGTDLGNNPLFRSYAPTSSPDRTFPTLSDVLNNTVNFKGETLPTKTRTLHFRLTAVDSKGGSDNGDMQVAVDSRFGPFKILQPNNAMSTLDSSQPQVIEWDPSCSTEAPINCANVDILYSSDNGATFAPLVTGTPNDGLESVTLPAGATSQARVEIRCSDNIFYAVSAKFAVSDVSGSALTASGTGVNQNCGINTVYDVEPNDTIAFASDIQIPIALNGTVNSATDTYDYYKFVPITTGTYTFTLSGYGNNDLNEYLLTANSNILDAGDSTPSTTKTFSDVLTAGQTYYVRVWGKSTSGATAAYSLTINYTSTTTTSTSTTTHHNSGGGSMGILGLFFVILTMCLRMSKNHTIHNLVISPQCPHLSIVRWQAVRNSDKINAVRLYSEVSIY
jgi:hypothetical protein